MRAKKETFASFIFNKIPSLTSVMRDIEKIDFCDEISTLGKLVSYVFESAQSTNSYLNMIITYTFYNCIFKTIEVKRAFITLFNEGILTPAFSLNRSVFELWAAICFIEKALKDFLISRNDEKFNNVAIRLFSGSRYPVELPWGEPSTEKPIHINDMLEELEKRNPGAKNTYSFLCEYCHPNFLYNMYAFMASIVELGIWSNPRFLKEIKVALEKQLSSLEQTLSGIKASSKLISDLCLEEYGINFPQKNC